MKIMRRNKYETKKIKVTKENLQEFVEQYKDKYITIPENTDIIAWHYVDENNVNRERSRHISDYPRIGRVKKKKKGNLYLEDTYIDGMEVIFEKPVIISVDDTSSFKMSYSTYDEAYADLVPKWGNAYCKAGEIIRAYGNLCYSFYNNGDKVGCDNGGNTRAYTAGDTLSRLVEDRVFQEKLDKLYNTKRDDYYERNLESMEQIILDYINNNEELYNIEEFTD